MNRIPSAHRNRRPAAAACALAGRGQGGAGLQGWGQRPTPNAARGYGLQLTVTCTLPVTAWAYGPRCAVVGPQRPARRPEYTCIGCRGSRLARARRHRQCINHCTCKTVLRTSIALTLDRVRDNSARRRAARARRHVPRSRSSIKNVALQSHFTGSKKYQVQ